MSIRPLIEVMRFGARDAASSRPATTATAGHGATSAEAEQQAAPAAAPASDASAPTEDFGDHVQASYEKLFPPSASSGAAAPASPPYLFPTHFPEPANTSGGSK